MTSRRGSLRVPVPRATRFDLFLKRRYVRPGETRLARKRIFILPTHHGIAFGVTVFVMLMGALNYNNSLAFMLTFLLGGMALIATFHTYRNIRHLSLTAAKTKPAFAGQPVEFTVLLSNPEELPRYAVSLRAHEQQARAVDVPAHGEVPVTLSIPTTQRGVLPLGIVTVETRYPVGIYHAWSYVKPGMQCVVYPRPAPRGTAPLPRGALGEQNSSPRLGSDDFLGFRTYQAGDSVRHINWKALAHSEQLLTKQFSQPASQELWLDWSAAPGGEVEEKLSTLCRWVLDAESGRYVYGLRLPDQEIPLGAGEAHQHRCLEALALFETS